MERKSHYLKFRKSYWLESLFILLNFERDIIYDKDRVNLETFSVSEVHNVASFKIQSDQTYNCK